MMRSSIVFVVAKEVLKLLPLLLQTKKGECRLPIIIVTDVAFKS